MSGGSTVANQQNEAAAQRRASLTKLATYVAVFFLVWSLRAIVFIRIDEGIESDVRRNVYSNAVKFIIWVLPVFITLGVWRLRPFRYLKLTTPVNKKGLFVGTVVTLVWLCLVVLGEALVSRRNAIAMLAVRSPEWLSILAGVFFSPISEEILFRGFFLNRLNESIGGEPGSLVRAVLRGRPSSASLNDPGQIGAATEDRPYKTFRQANVISALLFMLAHWPYWVSKNGLSLSVIKDSVNVLLLGCLFGWLTKKTNSLWPAIGAHIANNFLSGLIHV